MYPNLKLQIWKSGLRQNRLAQILGLDSSMLSKIVNGFREPNPRLRSRIATLLEREEDWLFEKHEPMSPTLGSHGNTPASEGVESVVRNIGVEFPDTEHGRRSHER